LDEKLHTPEANILQRKAIESALTLIQNQNQILPLKQLHTLKIGLVILGTDKPNKFKETLQLYKDIDCYYFDKYSDSSRMEDLFNYLRHYNLIIAGIHNTDSRAIKKFGITPNEISFLEKLSAQHSVILDLFATPYALNDFKNTSRFKAIIVSYEDKPLVQDYSAQLIFGAIGAKGQLPVTASVYNREKVLVTSNGLRLKYSIPEEVHIDSRQLAKVDTLVNNAIRKGAMPGCEILAAKDGIVFYHKAFGYHTYDNILPVIKEDIYDLA